MSEITPFTFPTTGLSVRTLLVDGEPHFVAADVCGNLALTNITESLRRLDEDEFSLAEVVDSLGRRQQMYVVTEPGLYGLVLASRKPEARAFKRWIKHEVLPSIRKTGSYAVGAVPSLPDMATPEGRVAVAEALLAAAKREVGLAERIAELEPKAQTHDAFMVAAKSDRLVKQVAKDLGWREGVLRDFLLAERLIYRRQRVCGGFEYDFYAAYRDHFTTHETTANHTWGPCNHYTLYVTPRGMDLIRKRIADRQAEQQTAIEGASL